MLATAPSIDGFGLPLKYLAVGGEHPLRGALRTFLRRVNSVLQGRGDLVKGTDALQEEQFALRLKVMEWMLAQRDTDLVKRFQAIARGLEGKGTTPGLALLVENMRFALDVQVEFLQALNKHGQALSHLSRERMRHLAGLHYEQFIAAAAAAVPHPEASDMLVRWFTASLRLEAALLMADAVLNEEVTITAARLWKLNALLVQAAQEFGGGARVMGLIANPQPVQPFMAAEPPPKAWLKEQRELAELGFAEWFTQLDRT